MIAAVLLLVVAAGWTVLRLTLPTDGAPILSDPGYGRGLAVDPGAAREAPGLRPGDTVVAVDGVALDRWLTVPAAPRQGRPPLRPGAVLDYQVRRLVGGRPELVTVPAVLRRGTTLTPRLRQGALPIAAGLALLVLGCYTLIRRPADVAPRAIVLFGAGVVGDVVFQQISVEVAWVVSRPSLALVGAAAALMARMAWLASFATLAVTFPSPPLLLRRRPWLVLGPYAAGLLNVALLLLTALIGHATLARLDMINGVADATYWAFALLTLAGLGRTVYLARRDGSLRRQAALVGIALATTILTIVVGNIVAAGDRKWPGWVMALTVVPVPIAVAVAILRGEFLDIRTELNRALVYLTLSVALLTVFVAVALVVGAVAGTTGVAATLPATALVAVAFAPLRDRLQHAIDRMLYGARGDPARALGALAKRLEAAVPAEEVLATVAETVAETLRLPYVAIAVGGGDRRRLACERGDPPDDLLAIPLVARARPVGELVLGHRRGERSLSPADRAVLAGVAGQVAAAVDAAALVTDLAASRSQLAVAREEERARVRHDLHDRLASHLVGLTLQLTPWRRRRPTPVQRPRFATSSVRRTGRSTRSAASRVVCARPTSTRSDCLPPPRRRPRASPPVRTGSVGRQRSRARHSCHVSHPRSRRPLTRSRWRRSRTRTVTAGARPPTPVSV